MTDSVFHKIFLITCTGFRLRQRHQTAVLHINFWKLSHGRYSPAKHHVSEVHLIGYASYFNKKSNLSSKLISRSKKFTSEQASWIFLKNYLGILRPGSNCSQVWRQLSKYLLLIAFYTQSSIRSQYNRIFLALLRMRGLLEGGFFVYHHAVNHPHKSIILSWFSIPLVLKCAGKFLKIGIQIKI